MKKLLLVVTPLKLKLLYTFRIGLKEQPERVILGNAQGALTGLFMLWWAFLARNSGK